MTSPRSRRRKDRRARPTDDSGRRRARRVPALLLAAAAASLPRARTASGAGFDPAVLRLLDDVGPAAGPAPPDGLPRCCLNFFGLPRSFRSVALPSIVKNVLVPNARYGCDVVVHYYDIDRDAGGRYNRGGAIDADSVRALGDAARTVAERAGTPVPSVVFKRETNEDFLEKYGGLVREYETATSPRTGKPKYYPWFEESYAEAGSNNNILRNIVMQWNSIQSAWEEMETHAASQRIEYGRVAFFRTDAFYAFPVDIYQRDKDTVDYENTYAVVPAFGKFPANDRMIYGPVDAVRIWATERFQRLEHHVLLHEHQGYGMHSERYMGMEILPAVAIEAGVEVVENTDVCFFRTRAGDRVVIDDCSDGGMVRGISKVNKVALIQDLVGQNCSRYHMRQTGGKKKTMCRCRRRDSEKREVA